MDSKELGRLLQRPESATLEFKREFYALDAAHGEAKRRQTHEMIDDQGYSRAGETAYLIIGDDAKGQIG